MAKIEAIIWDWKGTPEQHGCHELFPGVEKMLEELKGKGYKMSAVSKATSDNVENRFKQLEQFKKYFDVIIADTVKTPEQFTRCLVEMSVKPENTLIVDGRMDRGIQIGNALGCQTAWIKTGRWSYITPNAETRNPTYKINSALEVLTIIT